MNNEEKLDADIQRKKRLVKQLKRDAIIKTAGFIAAAAITFTFIFGVALAPSNDMFPAVHEGDMIIYFRPGRIVNTDVVVYEAPDGSLQIGRIEGTGGETVGKTESGLLTINGNIQPVKGADPRRRIDGTMALIDAYVVYMNNANEYLSMI